LGEPTSLGIALGLTGLLAGIRIAPRPGSSSSSRFSSSSGSGPNGCIQLCMGHPRIVTIVVDRLEIKRSLPLLQMPEDYVTQIMGSQDIPVDVGFATRAIQPADLDLGDKVLAPRAFLAAVVFIYPGHYITKGSRLL